MERKTDRLRRQLRAGEGRKALALAATFQDLGEYDVAIRRAREAWWHPLFFARLGAGFARPFFLSAWTPDVFSSIRMMTSCARGARLRG